MKHDFKKTRYDKGIEFTNDNIQNCIDKGAANIKNTENHAKNLAASN